MLRGWRACRLEEKCLPNQKKWWFIVHDVCVCMIKQRDSTFSSFSNEVRLGSRCRQLERTEHFFFQHGAHYIRGSREGTEHGRIQWCVHDMRGCVVVQQQYVRYHNVSPAAACTHTHTHTRTDTHPHRAWEQESMDMLCIRNKSWGWLVWPLWYVCPSDDKKKIVWHPQKCG